MRHRQIARIVLATVVAFFLMLPSTASAGTRSDRDRDGMPDRWERAHGLRVGVNDAGQDPDRDGLTNTQEYQIDRTAEHSSHPKKADTDRDRIADGDEDHDRDGIATEDEFGRTNPLDADTDDDGVEDGDEDSDGDGLEDEFELGSVDKNGDDDGDGIRESRDDNDRDGVPNNREFNPDRADSDRDGILDGAEDEDADGLDNDEEDEFDVEPDDADSDNDGVEDGDADADGDGEADRDDLDGDDAEDEADDDYDDADLFATVIAFDVETGLLVAETRAGLSVGGTVIADTELLWESSGDGKACLDGDEASVSDLVAGTGLSEMEADDDEQARLKKVKVLCARG